MAEKKAKPSRGSLIGRASAAARKAVGRSGPAKKAAPVKKAAVKKTAPKKAAAKKAAAKKAAPVKVAVKKAAPKKAVAKKTVVKKAAVKKAAPVKKTAVKVAAPKKPAVKKAAPKQASPAKLVVLEAEEPWTKAELAEVRTQLRADVKRLEVDLSEVEGDLSVLMRDAGESAGSDQADIGSATFERDQEMTIVNNAKDMLSQSKRALERIASRTYGVCEICESPIGKNRLMAFPRATLCMTCKQREERR